MVSYLSDMSPEPIFRNSKSMADFHADFRSQIMAPMLSTFAFVFVLLQHYSVGMFARHVMILAGAGNASSAEAASTDAATAVATTSSYLSIELPTPSVSPYVILWTSLFAYAAWSAHARLRSNDDTNAAPATAASTGGVLLDAVLDKFLRPGVGLTGFLAVGNTLAKAGAAIGLLESKSGAVMIGSLPASITVAQALCGAMWGLTLWSAWIYIFQGSRRDTKTRKKKKITAQTLEVPPPPPSVDYNIGDGEEVELASFHAGHPTGPPTGAAVGALTEDDINAFSSDDASNESDDNDCDNDGGNNETAAAAAAAATAGEGEEKESGEGASAAAAAVEAAFAEAVRRRERRARIGEAISKILNGSSAGVLGRRHPLRRRRADSSSMDVRTTENKKRMQGGGSYPAAVNSTPAPPPSPSLISTFTAAKKGDVVRRTQKQQQNQRHGDGKVSKFRRVMAEIMNISNTGIFNARRLKMSSSGSNLTSSEAAAVAAACVDDGAFECRPEDGNVQAATSATSVTTKKFAKMLSNTLNSTSSGLITAKRRHSRRSFS